ncbi:MAG TPA: phosphotransferase [Pyrinomonadaceae bacterium]|nr:phosphotransferase [Pyrinomonadaceae bacterium]
MQLLEYTPVFDVNTAAAIAGEHFGIFARAQALPSERDQNFLLTNEGGEKFVLKIANALESRTFLEAQNSILKHLEGRVSICQKLLGDEIVTVKAASGATHFVRMVHYLPGVPLAEVRPYSSGLLHDLGRKLGQVAGALADFDHPAVHRDFHWDLANGNRVLDEFAPLIDNMSLRDLVVKCRYEPPASLRRSVIHGDANDYNLLVDPQSMTVTGLIDFGDMVYSYTVGDLAIAIAYVILDPNADVAAIVSGYRSEFELVEDELEALWSLVLLRLAMSVCLAAHQLRQQPENKYLLISQKAIEESLPRIYADDRRIY